MSGAYAVKKKKKKKVTPCNMQWNGATAALNPQLPSWKTNQSHDKEEKQIAI